VCFTKCVALFPVTNKVFQQVVPPVQLAIQYPNNLIHRCHTITRNTTASPFRLSQLSYCTCRCSGMWRRVSDLPKDRSVSIFKLKQSQSILVELVNFWRWTVLWMDGKYTASCTGRSEILYNNLICVSILCKSSILVRNQLSKLATSYHKGMNWLSI
jgi:hypothetical protein